MWHFMPIAWKGLNKKWLLTNRGLYCVIKRINDVNFIIKCSPEANPEVVHVDRLSRFHGSVPPARKTW